MLPNFNLDLHTQSEVAAAGDVLQQRQQRLTSVLHIDSGRVVLGVREDGQMRHQLGVVEGPFQITALEYSGSHNGEATYEITLASAGALTFTAL